MIKKNSLLIRTLSSFVMLIIFFVMVSSNNLIFLIFSQFLLFLASWETLRMLQFRTFEKNKDLKSNFLLSRCQIRKYDFILIILVNLFVFLLNFPFIALQILFLILISIWLLKIPIFQILSIFHFYFQ